MEVFAKLEGSCVVQNFGVFWPVLSRFSSSLLGMKRTFQSCIYLVYKCKKIGGMRCILRDDWKARIKKKRRKTSALQKPEKWGKKFSFLADKTRFSSHRGSNSSNGRGARLVQQTVQWNCFPSMAKRPVFRHFRPIIFEVFEVPGLVLFSSGFAFSFLM